MFWRSTYVKSFLVPIFDLMTFFRALFFRPTYGVLRLILQVGLVRREFVQLVNLRHNLFYVKSNMQ